MKNLKYYTIVGLSCLLIGRYVLQPEPKTITKEVIVYKEKKQENEKKDEKKVVKSTKTKKPDGTVVTETTITTDTSIKKEAKTDIKVESKVTKQTGNGVTLGLLAVKNLDAVQQTHAEAIAVVPFFGNLSFVGSLTTNKQVGLGLALEF